MTEERRSYDSQADFEIRNTRLAKDPQIIPGAGDKPLVKLTVVCTSRSERHSDLWVEITVRDADADKAAVMKKGDPFGFRGFPALRRWGDNDEKISFEVVRAELFVSVDLFMQLKERGLQTGTGGGKSAAPKKFARPASAPKKSKPVVSLDDDLEDE